MQKFSEDTKPPLRSSSWRRTGKSRNACAWETDSGQKRVCPSATRGESGVTQKTVNQFIDLNIERFSLKLNKCFYKCNPWKSERGRPAYKLSPLVHKTTPDRKFSRNYFSGHMRGFNMPEIIPIEMDLSQLRGQHHSTPPLSRKRSLDQIRQRSRSLRRRPSKDWKEPFYSR